MTHSSRRTRSGAAAAAVLTLALTLTACGGGGGSDTADLTPDAIDAALAEGGEITYWGWAPTAEAQIAAFEDAYPEVTVNYLDTGGGGQHNLKLQNAVSAGTGAPDVTMLEYHILPQFVLGEALVDLTGAGFGDLEDDFTPSTWSNVSQGGGIWGLPQDSGPVAFFYNQDVYDEYGITVPTTWDEFDAAARQLHDASGGTSYLAGDFGEPSNTLAMIRQAGGTPFQVDGTDVTIDLQDEGVTRWTSMWGPLVEEGILETKTKTWSDGWFAGLGDGTIAGIVSGAWMAGTLMDSVESASGAWRVAPLPAYEGSDLSSELGGSGHAVTSQSANPALAAGLVRWLSTDPASIDIFTGSGGFPSTVATLESDEFLSAEPEYFGGQRINEVFLDSAERVSTDWQFLPWQSYAASIFSDTVGQAYLDGTDLDAALVRWGESNIKYGREQGFTVNGE